MGVFHNLSFPSQKSGDPQTDYTPPGPYTWAGLAQHRPYMEWFIVVSSMLLFILGWFIVGSGLYLSGATVRWLVLYKAIVVEYI